jgi:hypothetical protein
MHVNRRPVLEIRYRFSSMRGEIEGSVKELRELPVDSSVTVLYDLDAPERNTVAKREHFRLGYGR